MARAPATLAAISLSTGPRVAPPPGQARRQPAVLVVGGVVGHLREHGGALALGFQRREALLLPAVKCGDERHHQSTDHAGRGHRHQPRLPLPPDVLAGDLVLGLAVQWRCQRGDGIGECGVAAGEFALRITDPC